MCRHVWREINDVRVCQGCGLTVRMVAGKPLVMFDRRFPNTVKKGRKFK